MAAAFEHLYMYLCLALMLHNYERSNSLCGNSTFFMCTFSNLILWVWPIWVHYPGLCFCFANERYTSKYLRVLVKKCVFCVHEILNEGESKTEKEFPKGT